MKGCARRVREGPRQGPAETRAETKRSNAGQPAGAAPAPAARSWQRPLPRARSAPNFSFTLSPPPSKKAGFWQRRGRRSGSAGSSWRPSRRGSRLPFASSRTSRGHPLAPTRARPRSRSQSQEAPACRKGTGDTPKPGRETGSGTSRSWKEWGHTTVSYGHVPEAKPEPRGGGVAACVAAVRPQPIGPLPGSLPTLTEVPPPTTKKPKSNKQQPLSHIWVSKPVWCGVGRARCSVAAGLTEGQAMAAPRAPRPLEGALGSRRRSGVWYCSHPSRGNWRGR